MKIKLFVVCFLIFLFGWYANDFFQTKQANAAKMLEYKVVDRPDFGKGDLGHKATQEEFQKALNAYAKQGWKFHSVFDTHLILER